MDNLYKTKPDGINRFLLLFYAALFAFSFFLNPVIAFAGPDGSGNNFFYKGPMAFAYLRSGKFLTEQALDYQSFNSKFNDSGSVEHLSYNVVKYVYAPQFIGTFKFLGLDNYIEAIVPFGKALMSTKCNHSRGGLDDPELYYGIYAYHYSGNGSGNGFIINILPQLSITFPYGNWNNSSLVNIGGDEWQFQPALTGVLGIKASAEQRIILNYAVGYSINKGHPTVNESAINDEGYSYTDPGNDFFTDAFLNYIFLNKFDVYDEVSYTKQYDNYGYFINNYGDTAFGYINGGYQDFIEGLGLTYHYDKSLSFDARALKDMYGENAPDGDYGEFDVVYDFK
ncbi:MAG: transporter [bacterium]